MHARGCMGGEGGAWLGQSNTGNSVPSSMYAGSTIHPRARVLREERWRCARQACLARFWSLDAALRNCFPKGCYFPLPRSNQQPITRAPHHPRSTKLVASISRSNLPQPVAPPLGWTPVAASRQNAAQQPGRLPGRSSRAGGGVRRGPRRAAGCIGRAASRVLLRSRPRCGGRGGRHSWTGYRGGAASPRAGLAREGACWLCRRSAAATCPCTPIPERRAQNPAPTGRPLLSTAPSPPQVFEKRAAPRGKYGGSCRLEPNGLNAAEAISPRLLRDIMAHATLSKTILMHDAEGEGRLVRL